MDNDQCSMLSYFFSLRSYLTLNTACLNYKNSFFAKSAYLTEDNVSHDNCIGSAALSFPSNKTLTTISLTHNKISLLNSKYRNTPKALMQSTKRRERGRPAPQTVSKTMCSVEVENSRQSNYPAVAIKPIEREKVHERQ